jgi:hypothetical protein
MTTELVTLKELEEYLEDLEAVKKVCMDLAASLIILLDDFLKIVVVLKSK